MIKPGAVAEQLAAEYLQKHGLKLLKANYSCRFGEVDLIMQDGETHVFIEVRLRSGQRFGGAAASIDSRKQSKLLKTAQFYLSDFKRIPPCRFDAVLMTSANESNIEWIKNAFTA